MLSWHSTHLWRRGAAQDVSAWPSGHVRRRCAPPVAARRFAAAARSSGLRVSRVTPRSRCFLRELGLREGRRVGERGLPLAPPDSRAAASRCDVGVRTLGLVRLGDRGEGAEASERCARAGSSQAARSVRPAPLGLVLELRHMLARGSSALPPRAAPSAILARSAATPASPRSLHARCSVSSLMLLSAIHHQVAVSC